MAYIHREIEQDIDKFMDDPEIIAISGPRQSGKTTMLSHIQAQLIDKHGQEVVHYISFEDELEKQKFVRDPRNYVEFYLRSRHQQRHFFLFDEVQYVQQAGKIFKLLFDTFPQVKFFVTGSASLDIAGLGKYLVGRVILFPLYPFSFAEMLKAREERLYLEYREHRFSVDNPRMVSSLFLDQLSRLLEDYITFGGYPRVVLEPDPEKKIILLRNIFSTYIEKDIGSLFGSAYREKAMNVLRYLAEITGRLVNFKDLAQAVSLYFRDLKTVLNILEQTYVIRLLKPFHKNVISELKKNPKYYFLDPGLRNALLDRFTFTETEKGVLFENYVFLILKEKRLAFWRTTHKAEVDFVLKDGIIPVEVKLRPRISKSLSTFITHYQPQLAIIANRDQSFQEQRNGSAIYGVPFPLL